MADLYSIETSCSQSLKKELLKDFGIFIPSLLGLINTRSIVYSVSTAATAGGRWFKHWPSHASDFFLLLCSQLYVWGSPLLMRFVHM